MAFEQVEQFTRTVQKVCVRKQFERDQDIGGIYHGLRKMGVEIENGTYSDVGTDDGSDMREQIGFAIGIAMRHHRPMKAERDDIDGQSCAQLIQNLVANFFIGCARHQTAGHRKGAGAFNH